MLGERGHTVFCMTHRQAQLVRNDRSITPLSTAAFEDARPGDLIRVKGDVTAAALGLDEAARRWMEDHIDVVVHCAAITEFGLPDQQYVDVNIGGTRKLLDLLGSWRQPKPLVYVSTAYVSGYWSGRFTESDHDGGQEFGNAYEWSKFEAERLVRAFMSKGRPVTVVRPSIVVGDSLTGQTRDFRLLYPVLRVVGEGKVRTIAGFYDAFLDIVPIDFVAEGMVNIVEQVSALRGQTFHLVSGDPLSLRDACEVLAEFPSMIVPKVIPPTSFDVMALMGRERTYYERVVRLFECYFLRSVEFARDRYDTVLGPLPGLGRRDLFRKMIRYGQQVGYFGPADRVREAATHAG